MGVSSTALFTAADRFLGVLLVADPSQNLFSENWTEGNLYTISGIVDKLGSFACTAISFVGFFIVIFSILKNAFSGLYVVNPNFWDKVDEVKKAAITGGQNAIQSMGGQNGNQVAQKLGGMFTFILGMIPNVRALTDFDDDVDAASIDKKQYFMKSIPLLVAQILIGMLIFFGYPSKIANWIGTGATHALSVVLNNVDPIAFIEGFSDNFVQYNLTTDGSVDKAEQNVNAAVKEGVAVIRTKYTDMTKESTQSVAYEMEAILLQAFREQSVHDILGATEGYVYSIKASYSPTIPTPSSAYTKVNAVDANMYVAVATDGRRSYRLWIPTTSLSHGSTMSASTDCIVFSIEATPAAVSNVSTSHMVVFGGISTTPTISGGQAKVAINGLRFGKENGEVSGTLGSTVSVNVLNSKGEVIGSYTAKIVGQGGVASNSQTANLTFNQADWTAISGFLSSGGGGVAVDVVLAGSWNCAYTSQNSVHTWIVDKLRLSTSGTVGYALTGWTDYRDSDPEGNISLTSPVTQISDVPNRTSGSN